MTERFDCYHCNESLYGKKYILKEENPHCVPCFEELYANTCEECGTPIGCDCKDLSYKDRHWHEGCFHCSRCGSSLVDKPFAAKDEQLLCTDCYSNEYSSKCQECKKTIMPGTRKMEYKGSSWHETCFTCQRCQQPIGTKSFIPKENQNFCVPCYEKQYALQCVQCKKVLGYLPGLLEHLSSYPLLGCHGGTPVTSPCYENMALHTCSCRHLCIDDVLGL